MKTVHGEGIKIGLLGKIAKRKTGLKNGLLFAPDGDTLLVRRRGEAGARALSTPAPVDTDPFDFFAAVVRGRVEVADTDSSSLANALVVARILDAAHRSAATGRTMQLDGSDLR